jgi:hypothetical protein
MEIFNVTVLAHCPPDCVKIWVDVPTVEVLIVAGLQVPVMPFVDVVGNTGGTAF